MSELNNDSRGLDMVETQASGPTIRAECNECRHGSPGGCLHPRAVAMALGDRLPPGCPREGQFGKLVEWAPGNFGHVGEVTKLDGHRYELVVDDGELPRWECLDAPRPPPRELMSRAIPVEDETPRPPSGQASPELGGSW